MTPYFLRSLLFCLMLGGVLGMGLLGRAQNTLEQNSSAQNSSVQNSSVQNSSGDVLDYLLQDWKHRSTGALDVPTRPRGNQGEGKSPSRRERWRFLGHLEEAEVAIAKTLSGTRGECAPWKDDVLLPLQKLIQDVKRRYSQNCLAESDVWKQSCFEDSVRAGQFLGLVLATQEARPQCFGKYYSELIETVPEKSAVSVGASYSTNAKQITQPSSAAGVLVQGYHQSDFSESEFSGKVKAALNSVTLLDDQSTLQWQGRVRAELESRTLSTQVMSDTDIQREDFWQGRAISRARHRIEQQIATRFRLWEHEWVPRLGYEYSWSDDSFWSGHLPSLAGSVIVSSNFLGERGIHSGWKGFYPSSDAALYPQWQSFEVGFFQRGVLRWGGEGQLKVAIVERRQAENFVRLYPLVEFEYRSVVKPGVGWESDALSFGPQRFSSGFSAFWRPHETLHSTSTQQLGVEPYVIFYWGRARFPFRFELLVQDHHALPGGLRTDWMSSGELGVQYNLHGGHWIFGNLKYSRLWILSDSSSAEQLAAVQSPLSGYEEWVARFHYVLRF